MERLSVQRYRRHLRPDETSARRSERKLCAAQLEEVARQFVDERSAEEWRHAARYLRGGEQ
jgi:hypothetical protein